MKSRVYASPHVEPRRHIIVRREDETDVLSVDWNAVLHDAGDATISTSTWATTNATVAALSGSANSGGISTVTATFPEAGCAKVTNTMTMSDGQIRKQVFGVRVRRQPT